MRALVTGATGLVGSHLTRRLVQDGHAVRILARPASHVEHLQDLPIEIVRGDVTDADAVDRAAAGVEAIYHLASNFRQAGAGLSASRAVHVQGTAHVVRAALAHRVQRLVHCSTGGVHAPSTNGALTEDAPYHAPDGNAYEATKVEAEQLVFRAAAEEGLPAAVIRPGIVYGPGDRRLLKLFRAIAKRRFVMFGEGRNAYHLAYVDDVIDGMVLCGTRPEAIGQAFFLAGAACPTLEQVITLIARAVGAKPPSWRLPVGPIDTAARLCEAACRPLGIAPPLTRRRVDFFRVSRILDISKARRLLGYAPQVDLAEGIRRTARWYREQGWLNG